MNIDESLYAFNNIKNDIEKEIFEIESCLRVMHAEAIKTHGIKYHIFAINEVEKLENQLRYYYSLKYKFNNDKEFETLKKDLEIIQENREKLQNGNIVKLNGSNIDIYLPKETTNEYSIKI